MLSDYQGSHKYDSPMAAYLDERDEWADETTGDVECATGHVARFGRRLLHTDNYGFVGLTTCASVGEAKTIFTEIDSEYGEWCEATSY